MRGSSSSISKEITGSIVPDLNMALVIQVSKTVTFHPSAVLITTSFLSLQGPNTV